MPILVLPKIILKHSLTKKVNLKLPLSKNKKSRVMLKGSVMPEKCWNKI